MATSVHPVPSAPDHSRTSRTARAALTALTAHGRPRRWSRVTLHLIAISITALMIFPLLWMLSTAFKGPTEIFTKTPN